MSDGKSFEERLSDSLANAESRFKAQQEAQRKAEKAKAAEELHLKKVQQQRLQPLRKFRDSTIKTVLQKIHAKVARGTILTTSDRDGELCTLLKGTDCHISLVITYTQDEMVILRAMVEVPRLKTRNVIHDEKIEFPIDQIGMKESVDWIENQSIQMATKLVESRLPKPRTTT